MQLTCENCGAEFDPAKVSRRMRFAVCAFCGTLHNIAEITAHRAGRGYTPPPIFLPDGVEVEESEAGVRIRFRPRNATVTPLVAGAILLAAIMLISSPLVWGDGARNFPGGAGVARGLWFLIGLGVLAGVYVFIADFLNYRDVLVTQTSARISTGPLPLRPAKSQVFGGLKNVIARKLTVHDAGARFHRFAVLLVPADQREIELVSGFADPEIADVLRHYILQALGRETRAQPVNKGRTRVLFSRPAAEPAPANLELACHSCGAPIPLARVRKELLAADCAQCGVIQDVRAFLRHGVPRSRRNPGFAPPWIVATEPDRLSVSSNVEALPASIVALAIAGIALLVLGVIAGFLWEWVAIVLGVIPALLAIGLAAILWSAVQGQQLIVTPDELRLARTPLASMRVRRFKRATAAQVVSLNEQKSQRGFALLLILNDNRRVVLLDGLNDWAHALYLEQQIERLLQIKDVTVANVRRPST